MNSFKSNRIIKIHVTREDETILQDEEIPLVDTFLEDWS